MAYVGMCRSIGYTFCLNVNLKIVKSTLLSPQCCLLQGTRLNTVKKFVKLAHIPTCMLARVPHLTVSKN